MTIIMKHNIRSLFAGIFLLTVSICFAQDYDTQEDITYIPMNTTLMPGTLDIEERYNKNFSVSIIGDEVMFNIKKLNIKKGANLGLADYPNILFTLPINPKQDYTLDFDFTVSDLNLSSLFIFINGITVTLTNKSYLIAADTNVSSSPKKWSLPKGNSKNLLDVKIQRKGRIITIFANGGFVTELNEPKTQSQIMSIMIGYIGIPKSSLTINSIKVEQGGGDGD